ncbi:hypothetical protein [Tenacibaculum finnmarkense]|uniref:hypothetical protein n=1 Tax=Tenacibaculum finnmarkense TaxID=2781243 RepID=UPI001EFB96DC|nr:hypothetical protein [Tenacibaculum finnmarkense]MCG8206743.1 hypothetical protein [Tenacibaculum finnmarkense genomovar finnmarkense]MCG8722881.1 hypothetical protein [Tenacibaculum finnmarkense]MCG8741081.1 hypothetical protein [Tenacibaculum finnmarkense]MCG8764537.1 hypothetical protein [Tenacibaculum finnmarkense]MCG8777413.1 hypothetical protein [Tenacibaculum finnmarkense]
MGLGKPINNIFLSEDFHFSEIDFELDSFIEYLELTNTLIDSKVKKYLAEYNNTSDEAKDVFFDSSEVYIKEKCLQLYYSSIVISLYSFLEQSFVRLAEIPEKDKKIKIEDISGNGIIFKIKKYLEKVIEIDFNEMNDEWNEITKLNRLRNLFVHSSNSILKKQGNTKVINVLKEIKQLKMTEISDYYSLEFENDKLIRHFIEVIRIFLNKIYTSENS